MVLLAGDQDRSGNTDTAAQPDDVRCISAKTAATTSWVETYLTRIAVPVVEAGTLCEVNCQVDQLHFV